MFDLSITGTLITPIVFIDILVHLYYDYRKIKSRPEIMYHNSEDQNSAFAIVAVAISTLGAMAVILAIIISWMTANVSLLSFLIIFQIIDPPEPIWILGLTMVVIGLVFHLWSRAERKAKVISWEMSANHELVTTGPYSIIRHPSYSSYIMIFTGLFILIPSLVTLMLLIGIPGYYSVAIREEVMLVRYFGDRYIEYQKSTGMLFPRLRHL